MFRSRQSRTFRVAILVVALCAMLGLSMAATSAQHMHLRSASGGQCDVCVTAHIVSLEAHAAFYLLYSVQPAERLAAADSVAGYQLLLESSSSSRGPPSRT